MFLREGKSQIDSEECHRGQVAEVIDVRLQLLTKPAKMLFQRFQRIQWRVDAPDVLFQHIKSKRDSTPCSVSRRGFLLSASEMALKSREDPAMEKLTWHLGLKSA